jgi:multidrug efflux system membrane fusion protein
VLLQAGNMVRANDANALAVINQVRPIYVNFAVPEQSLPEVRRFRAGGPLTVDTPAPNPGVPPIEGSLIFIDNAVDPSTGTIRLRAQFDNADAALWPGQFVTVRLKLTEQPDAIVIPSPAVQNGPDGQYVYVVGSDMVADVRKITILRTDGERTIVATGLQKGERVVTKGQLRLGPKTRVQIGKPGAEVS